jgi:hypothetical protein
MIPFRSGRENKKMFYVRLTTGWTAKKNAWRPGAAATTIYNAQTARVCVCWTSGCDGISNSP